MPSYAANPNSATGAHPVVDATNQGLRLGLSAVTIDSIATVLTPTSGKRYWLLGGYISTSADASVLFENNAAGAANFVFRTPVLLAKTPFYFSLGNGYLSPIADQVLKATGSASSAITGTLFYLEV